MQYYTRMKRALRFPLRWAGRNRTLLTAVALSAALGACDNVIYGAHEGTMEYPGSGASPGAVPTYVVRSRDTVDGIGRRYGVSPQSIIDRNHLQAPYTLQPGQTIEVPGARVVEPSGSSPAETQAASATGPRGPVKKETLAPPPGSSQSEAPNPAQAAPGEPTPLSPAAATAPPPLGSAPHFQWPIKGRILTTYGNGAAGQKSDGIDIAAEPGAPVKAADGGKVVYVGNEVAQYGNLVLIEHSAGYITAYGNNDAILVKKDETVKKGQVIAKVGTSGNAASPRLHFEIRRGGNKALDPMSLLPPQ